MDDERQSGVWVLGVVANEVKIMSNNNFQDQCCRHGCLHWHWCSHCPGYLLLVLPDCHTLPHNTTMMLLQCCKKENYELDSVLWMIAWMLDANASSLLFLYWPPAYNQTVHITVEMNGRNWVIFFWKQKYAILWETLSCMGLFVAKQEVLETLGLGLQQTFDMIQRKN